MTIVPLVKLNRSRPMPLNLNNCELIKFRYFIKKLCLGYSITVAGKTTKDRVAASFQLPTIASIVVDT